MMVKEVKKYSLLLVMFISVVIVAAHVEHAEPGIEKGGFWYQIFIIHDWIHPIFFLLMVYSCYYVRIFSSRKILHQPKACLADCSSCYKQEGWLKQHHRYFFWGTLLLSFIHLGEVIPSLKEISSLYGFDFWVLINILLVVLIYFLELFISP